MINLIWAMDVNWLIGNDDKLPWRYVEDINYFKQMVRGKTVLMGDKTYESLKGYYKKNPFPFSNYYIASLDSAYQGSHIVRDIDLFLKNYQEELWVIGGSKIYELSLPYANRLYITWILKPYKGNKYFPKFDLKAYHIIKETKGEHKDLSFMVYEK